ncbi:MAG: 2-amino-4-hydroxy-6-hydroxymethyldihydropteridine diphosphokinase [Nitrosomonadales bacterium]|nr:2-amino-4-hydroxy-6-hydroxymethyldihydropteridine diphosphokinase [Nitrosomonadales bacterium]
MTRHIAYIGLGSNLEEPRSQLQRAFADLDNMPGTSLLAQSALYRSAPLGYLDQPDFVNAVAKIDTALSPRDLLQVLLKIEHTHGRERTFRNAPRTLDLDILLYDELQLHEHGLSIPHPQMHLRAFVLQPLLELAPDCVIPAIGAARLARLACQDQELERLDDAV